jgi:hypothetical protein
VGGASHATCWWYWWGGAEFPERFIEVFAQRVGAIDSACGDSILRYLISIAAAPNSRGVARDDRLFKEIEKVVPDEWCFEKREFFLHGGVGTSSWTGRLK